MIEAVVGSALASAAHWLKGAGTSKHDKKLGQAAHLLYEAGLTVVLLRAQRKRLYEVLGPLRDFRPHEWPSTRRAESIAEIRAVVHAPDRWYESIHGHVFTLQKLTAEPKASVLPLRDAVIESATNITHLGYTIYDEPGDQADRAFMRHFRTYAERGRKERSSWQDDTRSDAQLVGPDALIRDALPALFWLVENARSEDETDDLRRLVQILLTTRSRRTDDDLDHVVKDATQAFGKLRGILLAENPELPPPTWADSDL